MVKNVVIAVQQYGDGGGSSKVKAVPARPFIYNAEALFKNNNVYYNAVISIELAELLVCPRVLARSFAVAQDDELGKPNCKNIFTLL
ncbi:MAG: hypothetical protein LUF82_00010 [Clostridia bacterium]|nr:hypothetical protein [Clostridia bacterium]